jgi:hypothetical protein
VAELAAQVEVQPGLDKGQIEPAAVVGVHLVHPLQQAQHAVGVDPVADELPEAQLGPAHRRHADHGQLAVAAGQAGGLDIEVAVAFDLAWALSAYVPRRADNMPVCSSQIFLSHWRQCRLLQCRQTAP